MKVNPLYPFGKIHLPQIEEMHVIVFDLVVWSTPYAQDD